MFSYKNSCKATSETKPAMETEIASVGKMCSRLNIVTLINDAYLTVGVCVSAELTMVE